MIASLCRLTLLLALAFTGLGFAIIAHQYPAALMILLALWMWRRSRQISGSGWSHGSARFGQLSDLAKNRMLCDTGIILGTTELLERPARLPAVVGLLSPLKRSEDACRGFLAAFTGAGWQSDQFIRIVRHVHIATFAKTGSGKGVSLILPNLLSYLSSVVAIDIKGELWKLTAQHRHDRLGHQVIKLDPLGITGPVAESATLNRLDFVDETSNDFLDQCRDVAHEIVVKTGKEHDEHWIDAAILVITAFVAFVCGCESDRSKRNLNTVRLFVTSRIAFANAIHIMQLQTDACGGVISRLGHILTWFVDRELGSVLTTVQRFTAFLDSPAIQHSTASSSFDPRALRSGKVSLYLCLQHDKVTSLAPLQRMWISTIMHVLSKDGTGEKNSVLFILDEAAHLGRVDAIERAVTLYRGMGIRLWFAFQSLGQVKEVYGDKADVILDNIGTQQYFSVSAFNSAKEISDRIGDTTIAIRSVNTSVSSSRPAGGSGPGANQPGNVSSSTSTTYNDTARKLVRPEEIMTMDENTSIIFHNNSPPVLARLIKYYDHPAFKKGGTGKPRRLGLAAGLVAVMFLVCGFGFLGVAASLPDPASLRQTMAPPRRQPTAPLSPAPAPAGQWSQPHVVRRQTPTRSPYRPQGGFSPVPYR